MWHYYHHEAKQGNWNHGTNRWSYHAKFDAIDIYEIEVEEDQNMSGFLLLLWQMEITLFIIYTILCVCECVC